MQRGESRLARVAGRHEFLELPQPLNQQRLCALQRRAAPCLGGQSGRTAASAGACLLCARSSAHASQNVNGRITNTELYDALRDAAVINGESLTEIRLSTPPIRQEQTDTRLASLLDAAPRLCVLEADCYIDDVARARAVLRRVPPFGPVCLSSLFVNHPGAWRDEADVASFAADLEAHGSLSDLVIGGAADVDHLTAVGMGALVDACISLRVKSLWLISFGCWLACLPAITRLVSAGWLQRLAIRNGAHDDMNLFEDGEHTRHFCNAVRASPLMSCMLDGVGPPNAVVDEVIALIAQRRAIALQHGL